MERRDAFLSKGNPLERNAARLSTTGEQSLRLLNTEKNGKKEGKCLVSLVVQSATATLAVLGSIPGSRKSVIGFFYEILSNSSELGYVPGSWQ